MTRVCASHDCGEMVNPDGVANQVEGGVLQTVSRTLMESVVWDRNKVASVDWASYPIMRHDQAPKVEVALIDRPGTVAWGAGEPMGCAIPAAIANAVFDATGARVRSVPLTPSKVKAALASVQPRRGTSAKCYYRAHEVQHWRRHVAAFLVTRKMRIVPHPRRLAQPRHLSDIRGSSN